MQQPTDEKEIDEGSHAQDARVLGTDRFRQNLPFTPYRPRSFLTLPQLAQQLCAEHHLALELVCSRSAKRSLTPVRLAILRQALAHRVGTLTEVARFLNRDPSALSKLLARYGHS
jgi:DNA-binding NtrC family response regulator